MKPAIVSGLRRARREHSVAAAPESRCRCSIRLLLLYAPSASDSCPVSMTSPSRSSFAIISPATAFERSASSRSQADFTLRQIAVLGVRLILQEFVGPASPNHHSDALVFTEVLAGSSHFVVAIPRLLFVS